MVESEEKQQKNSVGERGMGVVSYEVMKQGTQGQGIELLQL